MKKLLSDTRLVAGFAALVLLCLTLLVALGKVTFTEGAKDFGLFLGGLLTAWQRGTAQPVVEVVEGAQKDNVGD
jgi:hypothetical protein